MQVLVLVVTRNRELSRLVGVRKTSLLSDLVLTRAKSLGVTISISSMVWDDATTDEVTRFFLERADDVIGAVVILEDELREILPSLAPILFVSTFNVRSHRPNLVNTLEEAYNCTLRAYLPFLERFRKGHLQKLITLPKSNFAASELSELFALFRGGRLAPSLIAVLDKLLGALKERQTPKTNSKYHNTYYLDEEGKYFQLGHERHAQAETACPPHSRLCVAAARYRFGNRIDQGRHYNVNLEKDYISGVFNYCHGNPIMIAPKTHLNIFPNDYFT